jgi:hypothetical protein
VYIAEAVVQRDCRALAARMEDGCLRQLLANQADRAAERAKRLGKLRKKSRINYNKLVKLYERTK